MSYTNREGFEDLIEKLENTNINTNGVSFAGKSMKLDSEDDAKELVDAITSCKCMQFLNLEGNTLGVDAAKAVAKALESHSEFKQALWKDLFTGRMKTEIPLALKHLSSGLMLAGAQLSVLDLSDNAFGPIGVEALVTLLMSSTCYSLEVLKLNNNGLGISGGKMLAKGLLNCHKNGTSAGRPLALKVFIAGRNRLENEGAKALSKVFKAIGTLEQLEMPQNGIYHRGITAISKSLMNNPNLRVLNLNDNTVTPKGALFLANTFKFLKKLEVINLGDCLLKSKGACLIADALEDDHISLQEIHLDHNEIRASGGLAVAKAMENKAKLKKLNLQGNQFGEDGVEDIEFELKESGRIAALGSLSEDEEEDENEDEFGPDHICSEGEDEECESDSEAEDAEKKNGSNAAEISVEQSETRVHTQKIETKVPSQIKEIPMTLKKFLEDPTLENFVNIGSNQAEIIIEETKVHSEEQFLENFMPILMKVSSITGVKLESTSNSVLSCCSYLYRKLFEWASKDENISMVNNALIEHLGLIKSEDKKFKPPQNLDGCLLALDHTIQEDYFPQSTMETLLVFLDRPSKIQVDSSIKQRLLNNLKQKVDG